MKLVERKDVTISFLPIEILQLILAKLDPTDLRSAVMVSRRWKELIENPKLWKLSVKVWSFLFEKNIASLQDLCVRKDGYYSGGCLKRILTDAKEKTITNGKLEFLRFDFSEIDDTDFAKALNEINHLHLEDCKFSTAQLKKFFEMEETKLESLSLKRIYLTDQDSPILAQGLRKVYSLALDGCKMTLAQLTDFLANNDRISSQMKVAVPKKTRVDLSSSVVVYHRSTRQNRTLTALELHRNSTDTELECWPIDLDDQQRFEFHIA